MAALRPDPALAARICELPYDVMSSSEARAIAAGNPNSFLHVSKPEIDLEPGINLYDPRVYAQGQTALARLRESGALRQDGQESFYLYRQIMGRHHQLGLVCVTSCEEYLSNRIRRHELTRPEKEDDRVRHIDVLNAQTGPAFLIYPADAELDELFAAATSQRADVDFTAADGVRHTSWRLAGPADGRIIEERFRRVPALYIADGHHRSAAAARVYRQRQGRDRSGLFLSVLFPDNQVQILPYHRVLRDLNGLTEQRLLEQLAGVFDIGAAESATPSQTHEINLYLAGKWLRLRFRADLTQAKDPVDRLDVGLLQERVLAPLFGVDDPRTSERINFVGGIRGTKELERLVDTGEYACAFAMFPTGVGELLAVAEAGGLMPPKSTWFEPKLRDGMFSHLLE
ncbi:MAG: DUF1015 family protein [Verrucomicrobiota bacterium]